MESIGELVMERTRPRDMQAHAAAGMIKSILFHVHDDDGLDDRLQAALSLARATSAHLQLVQVVPLEAYTVVDSYGGTFVSGEILEALQDAASKVQSRLESQLGKEDVSWSYDQTTSMTVPELLGYAALSDLMVIGRSPPTREFIRSGPELLGKLVCSAHTPLCIPGDGVHTLDPCGAALVAWNGTVEAANAVRSATPLLSLASEVRIVRFDEKRERAFPDTRILEYLSRHGVHASLETRTPRADISGDVLDAAARAGASYVVMGGYSHSRAGEFLFGGVTRELLHQCRHTLVMAH